MSSDQLSARHQGTPWRSFGRGLRLFLQVSPLRALMVFGVSLPLAILPAIQVGLIAAVVQGVADAVGGSGNAGSAVRAAIAMGVLSVLSQAFGAADSYLRSVIQFDFNTRISELLLEKSVKMDLQQFEEPENYDKLQRSLQEGVSSAYETFIGAVDSFRNGLQLVSVAGVLVAWNPVLALAVIASPAPVILATVWYGERVFSLEQERTQDRRRSYYYRYLCANDSSYKELRMFGLHNHVRSLFSTFVRRFKAQDEFLARRQALFTGVGGVISVLVSSGAVVFAATDAIGTGDVGRIAGYLTAIGTVQAAATGLFLGIAALHQSSLFLGNYFSFMDIPDSVIRDGTETFSGVVREGITFENVSFKYPGTDRWVLRDINLYIPRGQTLAIVGHNGAGKTTFVKLLCRLYEPTSGRILIDGRPISDFSLESLRRGMGVIFQDFTKYEETLRTNIAWGNIEGNPSTDDVLESVSGAGAEPVVERLTAGLDTMLGRHFVDGEQLSIGQWQRVSLARALVRKAPILILDEPTSAIDAAAEADMFDRMAYVASESTCILIAHRFSTVRMADAIVVIQDGVIVEAGSHSELMSKNGTYKDLFTLQARGYK